MHRLALLVRTLCTAPLAAVLLWPTTGSAQGTPAGGRGSLPATTAVGDLWSRPALVSGNTNGGWWPSIAADDNGNVHVVWNASFPGDQIDPDSGEILAPDRKTHTVAGLFYTRGGDDGQRWTAPTDIALIHVSAALRSQITTDSSGRLHLLYKGLGRLVAGSLDVGGGMGQTDVWYTSADGHQADAVSAWSLPYQLTHGTEGYFSDLAVDANGVLHALWTESNAGSWGIYYSKSADGGATWSQRVPLEDSKMVWWYRAHLNVDSRGRVQAVWEVTDLKSLGSTRGAAFAQSTDSGNTWTVTHFQGAPNRNDPTGTGPGPQQPSVGVDGAGTILLVFRDPTTNKILYRVSADGAMWSDPKPIPGIRAGVARPYDMYDLVTDNVGHVHLAAVGYADGSETMAVLHAEWDGSHWSTPDAIGGSPANPEYPRLAIGPGNRLHAAWFVGDKPTINRAPLGIWYSSRPIAASSEPRADLAVPVPVVPTRTPRSVPTPAVEPRPNTIEQRVSDSSPTDGRPGVTMAMLSEPAFPLAVGLLPTLIVLAVVAAFKLRAHPHSGSRK